MANGSIRYDTCDGDLETCGKLPNGLKGGSIGKAISLKDEDYAAEVEESALPGLVDFWAAWCGPCQMMGPVIEAVAEEYEGRVKIAEVRR